MESKRFKVGPSSKSGKERSIIHEHNIGIARPLNAGQAQAPRPGGHDPTVRPGVTPKKESLNAVAPADKTASPTVSPTVPPTFGNGPNQTSAFPRPLPVSIEQDSSDRDDEFGRSWHEILVDELEASLEYKGAAAPDGRPLVVLPTDKVNEIRNFLFVNGPMPFMAKYLIQRAPEFSSAQILSALGFKLPLDVVDKFGDRRLQVGLQVAIRHVLSKRQRLDQPRTLDQFVGLLRNSKRVLVLTGAGISTSLGIPDFRSEDGLYKQLEHLGLTDTQEVFDINLFREDPSIFYSVAKKVLPQHQHFSPTHQFIKMLDDRGILLRNYTQNIDNLEHYAGIPEQRIVQCHGSFGTARCVSCGLVVPGESIYDKIHAGEIPKCEVCSRKRKRRANDDDDLHDESFGVMKPEITFFGESLPDRFDEMLIKEGDAKKCDLLICIGTSLKVSPVSEIVKVVPPTVPQIYISRTPAKHLNFDMSFLGSCDDVIELLSAKLGWQLDHKMAKRPLDMADSLFPGGEITADDGVYTLTPIEPEAKALREAEVVAEHDVEEFEPGAHDDADTKATLNSDRGSHHGPSVTPGPVRPL